MAENEASAAQIQSRVAGDPGSGVYPAVGVDRDNYVTPGSQSLGEIGVAFVTRHDHITRRTGASERILDVDIEPPLAGPLEAATRGVIAVKEDQQRMESVVQIGGPVNARPQLRHHLRRDKIVV